MSTHLGSVKWFNEVKGYGFIRSQDGSHEEFFVHYSDILGKGFKKLAQGDIVHFDVGSGPKGKKAINVELVESGSES
jgi:CspA family cold shock protein